MKFHHCPEQDRVVNEVLGLLQRDEHVLLQGPTGFGKTVCCGRIVKVVTDAGWRTLITVHRSELRRQMSTAMTSVGVEHGIIAPGEPASDHIVQVASIDTLRARLAKGNLVEMLDKIDLLVTDECHHQASAGWSMVAQAAGNAARLGMTATPYRLDGKPLAPFYSVVVRAPEPSKLIAIGRMVPARVIAPPANLNLKGVRKVAGDYHLGQLSALLDTDEVTRIALRSYNKWLLGKPAIIFCVDVAHCHHVAAAFCAGGWRAKAVDGGMSVDERDAAIRGLATGDTQILTSCQIVSEGTDIPCVAGAILLRPTLSTGLHKQQVGRTLRAAPDKVESLIIDLVENTRTHGLPDAACNWSLTKGLISIGEPPTRCGHCWRVFSAALVCPGCGARTIAKKSVATLTEQTIVRAQMDQLWPLVRCRADLELIAAVKGYAPGWVHHRVRQRPDLARRTA